MAKLLTGVITSAKNINTVVVRVERKFRHKLYRKVLTKHKSFQAHYEDKELHEGDLVTIRETKPISKNKHFIVIDILSKEKAQ